MPKRAYLRDPWNVLDIAIVGIGWTTLALSNISTLKSLKTLRLLRVLRVLRSIRRLPGLKLVVVALLKSVVPIANVIPVVLLVFMLFSIVSVSYLKGAMEHCTGPVWSQLSAAQQALVQTPAPYASLSAAQQEWAHGGSSGYTCYADSWSGEVERGVGNLCTSKVVCDWIAGPGAWQPVVRQSFNNVFEGISALLQICTNEDWTHVALAAVDSVGIEMQPVEDNNPIWLAFFMLFQTIGGYFLVNLFVGVMIVTFHQEKESKHLSAMRMSVRLKVKRVIRHRARNRGEVGGHENDEAKLERESEIRTAPMIALMSARQERWSRDRASMEWGLRPQLLVQFIPFSDGFYHSQDDTIWNSVLLRIDRVRAPFFWLVEEARCGVCPINVGERINICRFPWLDRVTCCTVGFEHVITACILLNTVTMSMLFVGQPDWYSIALECVARHLALVAWRSSIDAASQHIHSPSSAALPLSSPLLKVREPRICWHLHSRSCTQADRVRTRGILPQRVESVRLFHRRRNHRGHHGELHCRRLRRRRCDGRADVPHCACSPPHPKREASARALPDACGRAARRVQCWIPGPPHLLHLHRGGRLTFLQDRVHRLGLRPRRARQLYDVWGCIPHIASQRDG